MLHRMMNKSNTVIALESSGAGFLLQLSYPLCGLVAQFLPKKTSPQHDAATTILDSWDDDTKVMNSSVPVFLHKWHLHLRRKTLFWFYQSRKFGFSRQPLRCLLVKIKQTVIFLLLRSGFHPATEP
ncbi:hypothetical protein CHARACLAT_033507 [Characodon lateralis]|uniref:Uncharacterized protein n=1 Tax=Characodon lateralis TaxID=208331 RepID=A0ABU7EFA1_9TELE|nr:hypothetical protein [Characodon lateralis]